MGLNTYYQLVDDAFYLNPSRDPFISFSLEQFHNESLNYYFFKKNLEDISPFCGATDTPVLDFW